MEIFDLGRLAREVDPHRNEVVEVDGLSMPKSAAMLLAALATQTDYIERSSLYSLAVSECGLGGNTAAAVKLAQAYHQEFYDDVSLIVLSRALVANNELEAGLLRAKEAFELTIKIQEGINNAGGNLVRLSLKTESVDRVNEAIEALIDSTDIPRKGDCVLDFDWCDKAEALGADVEMLSWIRSVAAAQTEHMERKRRLASKSQDET